MAENKEEVAVKPEDIVMKVRRETRTIEDVYLDFPGYTSSRNLTIVRGKHTVKIPDLRIDGYRASYSIVGKTLHISFGCQSNIEKLIPDVIAQLQGKKVVKKGVRRADNGTFIECQVIEQSENFFITSTGKTYPKKKFHEGIEKSTPSVLTVGWYQYEYKGRSIAPKNDYSSGALLNKLIILQQIKEYVEEVLTVEKA